MPPTRRRASGFLRGLLQGGAKHHPTTTQTRRHSEAPPTCRQCHDPPNDHCHRCAQLDNFVDDAANRRLGNGAKFYGKRKSSFYGEDDEMRKQDADQADAEEDYNGPAGGSFFVLGERDEQGRPLEFLTRQEARKRKAAAKEAKWKAMAESDQGMSEGFLQALMEEEERKAKEREFEP